MLIPQSPGEGNPAWAGNPLLELVHRSSCRQLEGVLPVGKVVIQPAQFWFAEERSLGLVAGLVVMCHRRVRPG